MGKHMNKLFNISLLFLVAFTFTSFNTFADEPVDEEVVEVSEVVSEDEESDDEVADVGKVSVTGSRIKRINLEGATPITVITRADIDANGYSTVYDAVSNLTQNAGMTNGENYQIGFTPANQVIDLRDFGPGKTLVLVNGKRMADYPFPYNGNSSSFNWGSIPLAAVSRIEVLTAGASSVYGSEAVAGVINVILVDSVERTTLRATGTQFTKAQDGNGGDVGIEFTTGGTMDKFRWTVALEATQVDPMTTLDRPEHDDWRDGKTADEDFPWWAMRMYGADPSVGGYQFWGPSSIHGPDGQNMGYTCAGANNIPGVVENNYQAYSSTYPIAGTACIQELTPPQTIRNERENNSVFASGTYTINEQAELYFKAMQFNTTTTGTYFAQFYYPLGDFGRWSVGYSDYGPAELALPNPVTGGVMYMMDWNAIQMFNPPSWDTTYEETSETFDLGVRGTLNNGWEYDVSATINDYLSESDGNAWNAATMQDLYFNIGGTDALGNPCVMDAFDLFADGYWDGGFGTPSNPYGAYNYAYSWGQPTCLNVPWIMDKYTNGWDYEEYQIDNFERATSFSDFYTASLVGEFGMLAGGPIGFAAVVEYQETGYDVEASQNNKDGLVWGTGYAEGGGSRDRTSFGGELRFPVTTELAISLSARSDEYDDASANVDRTTVGGNFEYRPNDKVLLRGSYSESFRAPDMQRAFQERTEGFGGIVDWYQCFLVNGNIENCGPYSQSNVVIVTEGNKSLREELGSSSSLGMVWQAAEDLSITLDAYKVVLTDIVSNSSAGQIAYEEAVCRAQEAGTPLENAQTLEGSYCSDIYASIIRSGKPNGGVQPDDPNAVEGFASITNQPLNLAGQEYLGLDWSMNYSLVTDTIGDFRFSVRGTNNIENKFASEQGTPRVSYMDSSYILRSRQVLSASWSYEDWFASTSTTRIGHMNYYENTKGSPYFDTNLTVGYDINDDTVIFMTAGNIFDSFPDKDAGLGGSSSNPFYVNGRIYPIMGPSISLTLQATF